MRFRTVATLVFSVALLFAASGAMAQNIQVEEYSLPNGLRVVLNEDHSAPLVAVNVWYHVGSKNEKPGRTGFAHLFEHMLFQGSKHVPPGQHRLHVQSVGGVMNGSTNLDRTNYYETVPSQYLPMALWLEADRMGFFLEALDQKKFDIQREVVKEERRMRYENVPYGIWVESLLKHAYPADYPYHWPTIGSMADLNAASLEDVRQFFREWYNPNNAVLTIVGDFQPAEAKQLVEKYFADIPRGPSPERFNARAPAIRGEQRAVIPSAVQLDRVYRMYHLPPVGTPDWVAADLLGIILTGNKSTRLEKTLVYEKQIAQDVTSGTWDAESTGMFLFWVTAKPGVDPARLEKAVDDEIRRIANEGVTADELRAALNQYETGYAQQLSSFGDRADAISYQTVLFDDPNEINRWLDRYRRITPDDIRKVAGTYLATPNRVTVLFTPEKKSDVKTVGGAR